MKLDEWKFGLRVAWENTFLRWIGISIFSVITLVSIYSTYQLLRSCMSSGYVVAHYSVYLGIDQVLPNYWIGALSLMPILLVSGTILCAYVLYRRDNIATYALLALAGSGGFLWTYFLYYLIKINF